MSFEELSLMLESSQDLPGIIAEIKKQFPNLDVYKKTKIVSTLCMKHGASEGTLNFLDSVVSLEEGLMSGALSVLACFHSKNPVVLNFIVKHLGKNKHKDMIWVYYNMSFNLDMSYVDECIDMYCTDKEKIKAWVKRLNNQRLRASNLS